MNKLLAGKKGSELDLFTIIVSLLSFSIVILVMYLLLTTFRDQGSFNQTTQSQNTIIEAASKFALFDKAFLAALVGLSLTSIISAAFIRTSPLFFVLSIVLLLILCVCAALASNVFDAIQDNNQFSGFRTVFPIMYYVMDHLMLYIIVMGALISIALYSIRVPSGGF